MVSKLCEGFSTTRFVIFTCVISVIWAEQSLNGAISALPDSGQDGDFLQPNNRECNDKCGCSRIYFYNETLDECVLDFRNAMKALIRKYDSQDRDVIFDTGMSRKIRIEAENLFRGIIISAILFIACAGICVITACFYCCHINYSDRKLKKDVKALTKKLNRDYNSKKVVKKTQLEPVSESCNIMVEEAGVFVV